MVASEAVHVLIASPLEAEHAGRIAAADSRVGICREIAGLLASAGVRVTGVGRSDRGYQVPGVTSYADDTQLAAVLPQADALILACPLTERTRGLIGEAEPRLLRPGAGAPPRNAFDLSAGY